MVRIAARSGARRIVLLTFPEVWAFETRQGRALVHSVLGRFDIDASLSELELLLGPEFLRVHPNWLVSLKKVRQLRRNDGGVDLFIGENAIDESRGVFVPVAEGAFRELRRRLLRDAVGP